MLYGVVYVHGLHYVIWGVVFYIAYYFMVCALCYMWCILLYDVVFYMVVLFILYYVIWRVCYDGCRILYGVYYVI